LKEIDKQTWDYAHRLFQCVATASRPLRAEELCEFLAFDFKAGSAPTFQVDWRSEDPEKVVLFICSTLLVVVRPLSGSPVIQFAHFSVKEYLTSSRLAETKDAISRFQVSMTPAHTIVAQACLGVLLHLDENITEDSLKDFPFAEYAAKHWVDHARFENVSSTVQHGMKRLFDPKKCHLPVCVWIYDPMHPKRQSRPSERPEKARAAPLNYAAFYGMHDIAASLIDEHSQDVDSRSFDNKQTPFHVALHRRHMNVAQLLLEHGADADARDDDEYTPLLWASLEEDLELVRFLFKHGVDAEARDKRDFTALERAAKRGNVELARILLEHGANVDSQDMERRSPLYLASDWGKPAVAQVLLRHGADVTAQCKNLETPLHRAENEQVARLLLEHGADANALDIKNRTPLHRASEFGRVGAARVLLEHDVDANARDANDVAPLHLASSPKYMNMVGRYLDVARLLLQYGSDIHARDDEGQTPFMRTRAKKYQEMMQLLLEHGAEDHRDEV